MGLAARITDMHSCPLTNPGSGNPHVGGPIDGPGVSSVLIKGQPAAVIGDMCKCAGGPPDQIQSGSGSVYIGGRPAARQNDLTLHGGKITVGCPSVIIGD